MTELTPLRILHLSDIHERGGRENDRFRRHRVLLSDAWKENVDEVVKEGPIDLVCITGDLADWGKAEEYEALTPWLNALLRRLKVPRKRLFLVPGNHDIDRERSKPAWRALRKMAGRVPPQEWSAWLAGGAVPRGVKAMHRDLVLGRTEAYRAWVGGRLGRKRLLPERSLHGRLGYRETLALPGKPPIHVIGLDSAWMCGDDNDAGKLLLTADQVGRLTSDEKGAPLQGFRLGLVHHPLTDLADFSECRDRLAGGVDLLLRGHLHRAEHSAWGDSDQSIREFAAGCLYEGDERDRYRNAFHVIDAMLNAAGEPQSYMVRLRCWSPDGAGFWLDDTGRYRDAPLGRLKVQVTAPSPEFMERPIGVFVGREDELRDLAAALLPASGPPRLVAVCALQGMAGVGKSYLAEHFAALHKARFPGGTWPFVLQPDEARGVDALLRALADSLKVRADPESLRARLRGGLLHIENADGRASAKAAAGLAEQLSGCAVLVTGRFQDLGSRAGWVQVKVGVFDEQTALDQLTAEGCAPASKRERADYRRLVRALGGLPLAVSLAAGHLRSGLSADDFLAVLAERRLALEPQDPGDPNKVLRASFELSLDLLRKELGADAKALLAGLAALGHAPAAGFGRSLGTAITALPGVSFGRLAAGASSLSLLQRGEGSSRWSVHPLLATLLREKADAKEVAGRVTEWFVERLPMLPAGEEALQGERWGEVHEESAALVGWLESVGSGDAVRVERAGKQYAMISGPFEAWRGFCERMLAMPLGAEERSDCLRTLGYVALRSGHLDVALAAAEQKASLDRERKAEREEALAQGLRADILAARGELDEALRIRREEELPVYERLGDVHARALTLGRIANILTARGELDEALRILRKELLPVFERLGDVRARALTLGKIGDILTARGELDEALRIRREEELPVFERLGEVRSRAVILGRIGDILTARGELDEALRIRREEELPVYERLGDVRSRAVTLGKIGDILTARGELDEALRILRKELLPVFERLGDVRSRAVTLGKIGDILAARGEVDEALRIRREEQLPVFERLGDVRSRAVTLGKIADILEARGELDEALRIRREEQLPVYERLGDVRELLVGRATLARTHLRRGNPGDREEAGRLLRLARTAAEAMRIPEAAAIRAFQVEHGLPD